MCLHPAAVLAEIASSHCNRRGLHSSPALPSVQVVPLAASGLDSQQRVPRCRPHLGMLRGWAARRLVQRLQKFYGRLAATHWQARARSLQQARRTPWGMSMRASQILPTLASLHRTLDVRTCDQRPKPNPTVDSAMQSLLRNANRGSHQAKLRQASSRQEHAGDCSV